LALFKMFVIMTHVNKGNLHCLRLCIKIYK